MKTRIIFTSWVAVFWAGGFSALAAEKPQLPAFLFGVCDSSPQALPYLQELGIHWARVGIPVKALRPELLEPIPTVAEVRAHPELIARFSRETDWSAIDAQLRRMLDAGVQPIPIIGHGYRHEHALIHGQLATPDRLGRERYLGLMYLYCRAVVERYDGDGDLDAAGIVIKLWQMENELNQAGLTAAWGWREPGWLPGLRSSWNDWEFLTRLLATLHQAVQDADPEAVTFMNFHTDIPPRINHLLLQPDWIEAVRDWKDLMEVIGFDAYPNYYQAEPVRGEAIGEQVRRIQAAAPGQPVLLVEVDYPSGPVVRGFSEQRQAEFLRQSYDAARRAGAWGYLKFSVVRAEDQPVAITEKDLAALAKVVPWWEQGKTLRLLGWAVLHARYLNRHFLDVMKTVEPFWGVVTPEGRKKPAFAGLAQIARENQPAQAADSAASGRK